MSAFMPKLASAWEEEGLVDPTVHQGFEREDICCCTFESALISNGFCFPISPVSHPEIISKMVYHWT